LTFEAFFGSEKLKLLVSREHPVVDIQTMAEHIGCERLFRAADGAFVLHMSSEGMLSAEERIIRLTARDALSWLNHEPDQFGSYWELAEIASGVQQSAASMPGETCKAQEKC
jgi:hypothetical protein